MNSGSRGELERELDELETAEREENKKPLSKTLLPWLAVAGALAAGYLYGTGQLQQSASSYAAQGAYTQGYANQTTVAAQQAQPPSGGCGGAANSNIQWQNQGQAYNAGQVPGATGGVPAN